MGGRSSLRARGWGDPAESLSRSTPSWGVRRREAAADAASPGRSAEGGLPGGPEQWRGGRTPRGFRTGSVLPQPNGRNHSMGAPWCCGHPERSTRSTRRHPRARHARRTERGQWWPGGRSLRPQRTATAEPSQRREHGGKQAAARTWKRAQQVHGSRIVGTPSLSLGLCPRRCQAESVIRATRGALAGRALERSTCPGFHGGRSAHRTTGRGPQAPPLRPAISWR